MGTSPELAVRRALHAAGFRYRIGYPVPTLPRRTIDIAFPKQRVAIFIDGCFWHACPAHYVTPKHNRDWWEEKINRNVGRDRETDVVLQETGWTVLRFWEHDPTEFIVSKAAASIRPE